MKEKKQNFLNGAFILVVATVIVKIIGFFYKVPLKNMIGKEAMGIFATAYNIYNIALVVSTVGLPAALSKMVAEANALGRVIEVRKIVRVGALVFIPLGIICTGLMFVSPEAIANAMSNVDAAASIRAIAPSVLLVCIISVFRGYYQGMNNMIPTAISQVIEAAGKLCFGLVLAAFALAQGYDLAHISAFTIVGITIGELCAAVYMVGRAMLKREKHDMRHITAQVSSNGELAKVMLMLAIPVTISSAITSITSVIDSKMLMTRLVEIGMSYKQTQGVLGVYNTMPLSLWNLPQTLITALTVSLIPTVSAAFASKDLKKTNGTVASAMRIGILFALPCAFGFLTVAGPILRLLFREDTDMATPMLQVLSISVPLVAIVALTNAALQGIGRPNISFVNMFIGAIAKMISEYFLIAIPGVEALGAPLSTIVCYAIIMILNLIQVRRLLGELPNFVQVFGKPFAASAGMGAVAYIVQMLSAKVLPDKVATLIAIGIAAVAYAICLLGLQAIRKQDVLMLPKGDKIVRLLKL